MRQLIRSPEDLNTFIASMDTVAKVASDSGPLTDSDRQMMARQILGFSCVEDMFKHFNAPALSTLYQPWEVVNDYKGEMQSFMVALPVGVDPSSVAPVELMAAIGNGTDFNPTNEYERLEIGNSFGDPLTYDKANEACAGVLTADYLGTGLSQLQSICIEANTIAEVRDLLAEVRSGCEKGKFVDLNGQEVGDLSTDFEPSLWQKPDMEIVSFLMFVMEAPEEFVEMIGRHGFTTGTRSFSHNGKTHQLLIDLDEGVAFWSEEGQIQSALVFGYPNPSQG